LFDFRNAAPGCAQIAVPVIARSDERLLIAHKHLLVYLLFVRYQPS
jgi:hypothetical protein